MKKSDFKHIVKESLREAFYTPKLDVSEPIKPRKLTVKKDGIKYLGILSKNTIPGEREYRVSCFIKNGNGDLDTGGHIELTKQEVEELLQNNKFPDEVIQRYDGKISLINVNSGPEESTSLNEALYGKRLKINYFGDEVDGVLSKNMKPDDRWPISQYPYRISWFEDAKTSEPQPQGHIELTQEEVDYILENQQFPLSVYDRIKLSTKNFMMVNPSIHESLLFLENSSREVDLWLENRTVVNESMTMMVSGANYKRTDRLDDLVSHLQDTVVSPVLRKINEPDQINYFQKNSVGFWNILSADGSYYENPDADQSIGTINLYPGGITQIMLRQIVVGILRQLKKLHIKCGKLKREPSGAYKISDVIRFPIIKNDSGSYSGPNELNFSNVNAYQIFHNLLQFEGENEFTMDAKELIERIKVLVHDKSWINKNIIKRTDSDWPKAERDTDEPVDNPHLDMINKIGGNLGVDSPEGGPRMIGMGLDAEGIIFRLGEILKVAEWAVANGHKTISVG